MTAGFISGGPVQSQSCCTQDNDSSIKSARTHQMAASTAPPSSLFGTCWVFPVKGKCAAGSSLLASSASPDRRHRRAQIWPQMFTNLWCAQLSALLGSSFPFLPNHRCRLYPHTLHTRADHKRRVDSFVYLVWNGSSVQTNLQVAICRFPKSLRSIPNQTTPRATHFAAACVGSETSLLRASLHDAAASKVHLHSLVDPSLLESSDVGYSFAWTTCRLPPKDTQQYAVQNRIQTGCKREATETHAGSHTHSPNRQRQSGV